MRFDWKFNSVLVLVLFCSCSNFCFPIDPSGTCKYLYTYIKCWIVAAALQWYMKKYYVDIFPFSPPCSFANIIQTQVGRDCKRWFQCWHARDAQLHNLLVMHACGFRWGMVVLVVMSIPARSHRMRQQICRPCVRSTNTWAISTEIGSPFSFFVERNFCMLFLMCSIHHYWIEFKLNHLWFQYYIAFHHL